MRERVRWTAVAVVTGLFVFAGQAAAAQRYAYPGGTGTGSCTQAQANHCSLFNAANGSVAGDEIIIEPGSYSGTTDLGSNESIIVATNRSVHGEPGQPRPVITSGSTIFPAFSLAIGSSLSHVEAISTSSPSTVNQSNGILSDSIVTAQSNQLNTVACQILQGTIRDTVCRATNTASGAGLGRIGSDGGAIATVTLRNVTALGSGTNAAGIRFNQAGTSSTQTITGRSVIARGSSVDVSTSITGSANTVTVALDHSNYSTRSSSGGTITDPATNSNQTAAPVFDVDGYHQLPSSPTINAGIVDGSSGTTDIDGQARSIGLPDIGADEALDTTSTAVVCGPSAIQLGSAPGSATCTATVTDTKGGLAPTGSVSFTAVAPGTLSAPGCTLVPTTGAEAGCLVTYTPTAVSTGTHQVNGIYGGDATHSTSQGSASLAVTAATLPPAPQPPNTSFRSRPAKKTTKRLAKFTFASDTAGATFQCKLDKAKAFTACRSPLQKRLGFGSHTLRVRATVNGVADSTPATYTWKIKKKRKPKR